MARVGPQEGTSRAPMAGGPNRFVTQEVARVTPPWRVLLRLGRLLPLVPWLLPLALAINIISSSAPAFFRWYAGLLADGAAPRDLPGWGVLTFSAYGLLGVALGAILARILGWASFELGAIGSSQSLFRRMVRALVHTRTTYFDEHPSGQLINRLVKDFEQVRTVGIISAVDLAMALLEVASVLVVVALSHGGLVLLFLPLLLWFFHVQRHRGAMVDLARSRAAMATGRLLDQKTDLLHGRETYLLYGRFGAQARRLAQALRDYVQASALTIHIESWSSFWIRMGVEGCAAAVLLALMTGLSTGQVAPALAVVVISALFGLTGSLQWLDATTNQLARQTAHARRVFELVDLPPEEVEEKAAGWSPCPLPDLPPGELAFVDYAMAYRKDSPPILDGLDLRIPKGAKVALVGRTGCGKTSVVQALLRLVHVTRGDLRLGSRSLLEMPLAEARAHFGVVPQQPYLFRGTVQGNLDRLGRFSPEACSEALRQVGLDCDPRDPVEEGGANFSQGQRPLLCLARVLLLARPIILLDEPTSGLDPETDVRIAQLMGAAFAQRTVLTIAHRPETLALQDRILVMEGGRIRKHDSFFLGPVIS